MPWGKFDQQVVHQDIALDNYLNTLLDEIPSDLSLEQVEKNKIDVKTKGKLTNRSEVNTPKSVAGHSKLKDQCLAFINPVSVMPDWSQHEFNALYFKVDKLTLAVPLTDLLRTITIGNLPTKIPGQPTWFIGLLDTHGQRIGVLDTGQLVYGKLKGQQRDLNKQPFKSILITYDGKWGLACDEILSIGKLKPEKVRWRTMRNKRPWLIGTVIEELTAIVDINRIVPHRKAG